MKTLYDAGEIESDYEKCEDYRADFLDIQTNLINTIMLNTDSSIWEGSACDYFKNEMANFDTELSHFSVQIAYFNDYINEYIKDVTKLDSGYANENIELE